MKKSIVALAVLGAFAGAASAQSSVTIYGLLDMSVAKSNGGTAPNAGAPGNKAWTVQQSAGSRLGFRGNEDLGGGLSAQFQIEHRFNPDTGGEGNPPRTNAAPGNNTSGSFWQGRSYVQLTSAGTGSVYLGRDYTPAFWPAVKSDPFGWDGVGQVGGNAWAGYLSPDATGNFASAGNGGVRTSNTVGVKSANFGGLTVQGAVALSEGTGLGRTNGFNVEYSGGPLYAAFGYEKVSKGSFDGRGVTNVALHYDLGVAKLMGYYASAKIGAGGNTSSKMFSIGALAPVGPGNVKAVYYRVDPAGANNNTSKLGLGYDYALSKRTGLYADLGMGKGDGLTSNTAYAFGVKHTF
jgi:predicted porin